MSFFVSNYSSLDDKNGNQKWGKVLKAVENPNFNYFDADSQKYVPLCFVICSGRREKKKIHLANAMLVDYTLKLQMKRPNKDKSCPYYKPSSQNVKLRTLFGRLSNYHGWEMGEGDFKGFKGALSGVLQEIYAKREKEFVSSKCLL